MQYLNIINKDITKVNCTKSSRHSSFILLPGHKLEFRFSIFVCIPEGPQLIPSMQHAKTRIAIAYGYCKLTAVWKIQFEQESLECLCENDAIKLQKRISGGIVNLTATWIEDFQMLSANSKSNQRVAIATNEDPPILDPRMQILLQACWVIKETWTVSKLRVIPWYCYPFCASASWNT